MLRVLTLPKLLTTTTMTQVYDARTCLRPTKLQALPYQYFDFVQFKLQSFDTESFANQLQYWVTKLSGVAPLELATDFVRPSVATDHGSVVEFSVNATVCNLLKATARRLQCSMFILLLSAFKILLYRRTGQVDVTVGSVLENRARAEFENLAGYFVMTQVCTCSLKDPFEL